jgi:hypothetical protein
MGFFKNFDMYGEPITLQYKGEDKYKTNVGACVSILLLIMILAYSLSKGLIFYHKADPDMNTLNYARDLDTAGIF